MALDWQVIHLQLSSQPLRHICSPVHSKDFSASSSRGKISCEYPWARGSRPIIKRSQQNKGYHEKTALAQTQLKAHPKQAEACVRGHCLPGREGLGSGVAEMLKLSKKSATFSGTYQRRALPWLDNCFSPCGDHSRVPGCLALLPLLLVYLPHWHFLSLPSHQLGRFSSQWLLYV